MLSESDLHQHIKARMFQRGISLQEIQETLMTGWEAEDTKEGTLGKVKVFSFNAFWEGTFFEEKEVTVYYKYKHGELVLLTAKARYGRGFARKEEL